MDFLIKLTRVIDRGLNLLLGVVLAMVFLYGSYALWDTWRIYDSAGADAELLQYKPVSKEGESGFAELRKINPDVWAWLTLEGTHIDYPVVQGEDNTKYVNTDVYGEFSLSGSLFLDYRCASDFSSQYSLVYGHHMDGQMMFGELAYYLNADYFEEHPAGTLYLPEQTFDIEIFASLQTDAYDSFVFYPAISTKEEQTELLEYIRQSAIQYRTTGITEQDRIIAFSTCSNASTNARTVVFGRLVENETAEGGASKV